MKYINLPFPTHNYPTSWSIRSLEDVCLEIMDGDWIETKDQGGKDYRLLQISNIGIGNFSETGNFRYITQETFDRLRATEIQPGDILVSRMPKPIGRAWLVKEMPWRMVTAIDVAIVRVDPSLLDAKYCSYYINSPFNLDNARVHSSGTTRPRLKRRDLVKFPIPLPPLPTQRKIAAVLSSYDDLIENNTRRIQMLEEMAQAIYREWFVNFRFPGYEEVRMVDSGTEMGEVPEGWEVLHLSEVCTSIEDGDWIEIKDQGGSDYRLLQISNIGVGKFKETNKYRYITQETFDHLSCNEINQGDILVARMPKPIGRAWLVTKMPWRMITAVDVAIIRTDNEKVSPHYCVHHLNSPHALNLARVMATGTTRPRITRRNLSTIPIIVPPLSIIQQFDDFVSQSYRLSNTLSQQSDNLRKTRDLLLPRLVSGEVDVSVLEIEVD